MAGMRIALTALALVAAVPAKAESVDRWRLYIAEAAARFGVPAQWIERVMRAESGGRTMLNGRPITSRAGAMGLMQIMPRTWADMRARLGLGNDPHAPRDNILAGTRSEEHTSELPSLMRISYAGFCLKKKNNKEKRYD